MLLHHKFLIIFFELVLEFSPLILAHMGAVLSYLQALNFQLFEMHLKQLFFQECILLDCVGLTIVMLAENSGADALPAEEAQRT